MNKQNQQREESNLIRESDREMLRSILQKDNERIKEEMRGAKTDEVFKLGFEGGGLEVTRFSYSNAKEYFVTSGTSMRFDESDDEEWVSWEDAPTASFAGSLAELRFGVDSLCIVPLLIHADYVRSVRNYIETLLKQVTAKDRGRMGEALTRGVERWHSRLGEIEQ